MCVVVCTWLHWGHVITLGYAIYVRAHMLWQLAIGCDDHIFILYYMYM